MSSRLKVTTYKYHPYIDEYMNMIESGKVLACKEQHELMEFVRWKLDQPNVVIDAEAIEKSVSVPAPYFPFELFPWQKFINAFMFGVFYDDGSLVFNRFLIEIGRGAGKNGFISWDSFFMMTEAHGIKNYDIDIVATSEDQAKTSFEDVYNVLDESKDQVLKNSFYKSKTLVQHKTTKAKLEFNTSNAKTKDGKRTSCVIFDEVHAYESRANVNVFTSGLGKKPYSRAINITTNGYVRGGYLDSLLEESKEVLIKKRPKSKLFPFICKLDHEDEVHKGVEYWVKANPSILYNKDLREEIEQQYLDMELDPSARLEFMTKRMNLPMEDTRKEVVTYDDRLATDQPFPENTHGLDCIAAIDFAQIRDFCSVGLLFKHEGKRYWKQHTFMHHTAPKFQAINEEIINEAIEKELLTVVYERSIEAKHVLDWLVKEAKTFNVVQVNMDLYRSSILKDALEDAGFTVEIVRKGAATHGMLSPLIDEMFIKHTIVFGDDPLMRWYVGNVYKEERANGNVEYLKIDRERRKTDGFFAFLHALVSDDELVEEQEFDPNMFRVI